MSDPTALTITLDRYLALVDVNDDLVAALRETEWFTNQDNTEGFCIVCGADRPGPHKPDCIVGRALAALEDPK